MKNTTQYQEALHFCLNNCDEVVARNMARDMIMIKELSERVSFLSNLCIRSKVEGWSEAEIQKALSAQRPS